MATWRVSLPKQAAAIELQYDENILRSEVSVGYPKVRRRFTSDVKMVVISGMLFTRHQVEEFEDFWASDLLGGVSSFAWEYPLDDSSVEFRFMSRPQFRMLSPGQSTERKWLSDFELEVIPSA